MALQHNKLASRASNVSPILLQRAWLLLCFSLFPTVALAQLPASDLPPLAEVGQAGLVSAQLIFPLQDRPTPECHASSIVETPSGLAATWFAGTHEKHTDVGIWFSRQVDGVWSAPVQLADGSEDEDQDYPCWNPVLFQPSAGKLQLFYKVGPTPADWWGRVMTSSDAGKSWTASRRLGKSNKLFQENQNLLGPVKNKPVELPNGDWLCPSSTENQGWRVHFERSADDGQTWQVVGPLIEPPSTGGEALDAIQPSVLFHRDGRLQLLCRTKQEVIGTSWSSDHGLSWSPVEPTTLPNPNAGTDAVTLADGRHLLVYNHSRREGGRNGRQILNVAISPDGIAWTPLLTLEKEGDSAGYSYPAVIQASDGQVHITYTWRRQAIKHVVLDPAKL